MTRKLALLLLLAVSAAACSSENNPPITPPPPGPPGPPGPPTPPGPPPPPPAGTAVSKLITKAEGGSIELENTDGSKIVLEVPAGALNRDVTFKLTPQTARAGAIVEFDLEPSDLVLTATATLRYVSNTDVAADAMWHWHADEGLAPFPTTVAGMNAEAAIRYTGYPANVPGALRPAQATGPMPPARAVLSPLECRTRTDGLIDRLRVAATTNDVRLGIRVHDTLRAIAGQCQAEISIAELQGIACMNYRQAAMAARARMTITEVGQFEDVVVPLNNAYAQVLITGADCSPDETVELITAKFDLLIAYLQSQLSREGLSDEIVFRDFTSLIEYKAQCDLMLNDFCERFETELYPVILDLLRRGAYDECVADNSALALAQLYGLAAFSSADLESNKFLGFANFSPQALDEDMAFCTNWSVSIDVYRNADTVPELIPDRSQTREVRGGQGEPNASGYAFVGTNGSVTVRGAVRVAICPDGTFSNDDLVIKIGTHEVARRPKHGGGNTFTLDTEPLDFVVARDAPPAGIDIENTNEFVLELQRSGDGCGGRFTNPYTLFVIYIRPRHLEVTPQNAGVLIGDSQQFVANIDGERVDAAWSASGGSITAGGLWTPDTYGTYQITANYNGRMASATASVGMPDLICDVDVTGDGVTDHFRCVGSLQNTPSVPMTVMQVCYQMSGRPLSLIINVPRNPGTMLDAADIPDQEEIVNILYTNGMDGYYANSMDTGVFPFNRFPPWTMTFSNLTVLREMGGINFYTGNATVNVELSMIGQTNARRVMLTATCHEPPPP